jgi:hypothetical protein
VQRVLDVDLDFFVEPPVHWPQWDDRCPEEGRHVLRLEEALAFMRTRCLLNGPLPGGVAEAHDEVFWLWRDAIGSGALEPPFHVTHLDAHADLGLGDSGWVYLMTDLLRRDVADRAEPRTGHGALNEGNFLLYALACRWLDSLEYVYGPGGGGDELVYALRDFDREADEVQLKAISSEAAKRPLDFRGWDVLHLEPGVPYRRHEADKYQAGTGFDLIFLTRSPLYTPASADALFDAIRTEFITC